jgi:hypothetical protein
MRKTALVRKEHKMRMPGFNAEASLAERCNDFRGLARTSRIVAEVRPQMRWAMAGLRRQRFGGDPDLGSYFRCRAAGGPELVCRFFAGLPPFTIGGLLF